ncbi:glycosyltransferase family 39 protein [Streptomyces sp. NPDC002896]|uniref:glycosyltransferase family 39 protein n=1 Tax=Streptomyces sp. NPDC002896 TaxID=3154438 RepID=UPI003328AA4D
MTAIAPNAPPPAPRWTAHPAPWLALVAVGYFAAQVLFVVPRLGHALGWDEAVYVSQVDPRHPAAYFSAPRSRGTSLLLAPVVAVTGSVAAMRVVLALFSSIGLWAAYRVWGPLTGRRAAALAALLFAGLWVTLANGPQAMPNLWVAFSAVGAAGWFLRAPAERRARWWLAGCLAAAMLFRFSDGVWLALPLLTAAALVRRRRRTLPWIIGGVASGAAEWTAEAYARFGGIGGRLQQSSANEGGIGLHLNFGNAWRSLDGPQLCRPCHAHLGHSELGLWWLALPLLVAVSLVVEVRRGRGEAAAVPIACAAATAFPYLLLITYSAPRFLLPAYALLSLPVAVLACQAVRSARTPALVGGLIAAAVALQLVGQGLVLQHTTAQTARVAALYETVGKDLRGLGVHPPCLVAGTFALAPAYDAGCGSPQTLGRHADALLIRRSTRRPRYTRGWTPHRLPGTTWSAFLPRS